jgi:predicted dehydrogenase
VSALEAIVIGAGQRGRFVYGAWARAHPERLRVVAIAEPDAARREAMAREHGLGRERVHPDWKPLLDGPRLCEVAIVATGDTQHVEPALAALSRGYHVLLEKPIAPDPVDCLRVVEAAERAGRILQIGHVLRYTEFYERVHEIAASGRLGEIGALDMREHVAHWHYAHSYVRGKFRNRALAAPVVLAKACHDLDLLVWIAGREPERVASTGGLRHYRVESAPAGAPARCADGCPVQDDCPHDAVRFYLGPDERLARIWPWSDVSPDPAREARRRALEDGPYGRCVYRCDNDVADQQQLLVGFGGGLTASFALHGFATHERRTLRISGSRGELRGVLQTGEIEVTRHGALQREEIRCAGSELGHYGGDGGLLSHFCDVLARGAAEEVRASGRSALASHLLGFAAERARLSGEAVALAGFRAEVERAAAARDMAPR